MKKTKTNDIEKKSKEAKIEDMEKNSSENIKFFCSNSINNNLINQHFVVN